MKYQRFAILSGVGVAVLALYVLFDHFVLDVWIPPGSSLALIRVAGILACLGFVSTVFVLRGLADLRAQRAAAHTAQFDSDVTPNVFGNADQEINFAQFVYSRRYVMWGWATVLLPLLMVGYSLFKYPGNYAGLSATVVLVGAFILQALDRSRWSFNIDKAGFDWGGFIRTKVLFASVQRVYVNHEYVKPILVVERKETIRKGAVGADRVQNFDDFAKAAIEAWKSHNPQL